MLFYILHMQMALHFFNDELSVIEMMKVFDKFSPFSGLIPNKSRCQVAGMGVLKGKTQEKMLRMHFSYNKQIAKEENFVNKIAKIENVLKFWRILKLKVKSLILRP